MPAVLWERSDGVGSITLNRPEAMNTSIRNSQPN